MQSLLENVDNPPPYRDAVRGLRFTEPRSDTATNIAHGCRVRCKSGLILPTIHGGLRTATQDPTDTIP